MSLESLHTQLSWCRTESSTELPNFLISLIKDETRQRILDVVEDTDHTVDLGDVYPDDFGGKSTKLHVPEYAFTPDDPWTRFFVQALSRLNARDAVLVEVGSGTGFNGIYLLSSKQPKLVIGSDIDQRFEDLFRSNIRQALHDNQLQGKFVVATHNLLEIIPDGNRCIDGVLACVPQVPIPGDVEISAKDNEAHYYDPDEYGSHFNRWGLGLNDHLLQQARTRVRPGGSVVLNLAGRPGKKIIEQLFTSNGYDPKILHKGVIQQCPKTELTELQYLERKHEVRFEFFESEDAQDNSFSADVAEQKRLAGIPIFHHQYAYQGFLPS